MTNMVDSLYNFLKENVKVDTSGTVNQNAKEGRVPQDPFRSDQEELYKELVEKDKEEKEPKAPEATKPDLEAKMTPLDAGPKAKDAPEVTDQSTQGNPVPAADPGAVKASEATETEAYEKSLNNQSESMFKRPYSALTELEQKAVRDAVYDKNVLAKEGKVPEDPMRKDQEELYKDLVEDKKIEDIKDYKELITGVTDFDVAKKLAVERRGVVLPDGNKFKVLVKEKFTAEEVTEILDNQKVVEDEEPTTVKYNEDNATDPEDTEAPKDVADPNRIDDPQTIPGSPSESKDAPIVAPVEKKVALQPTVEKVAPTMDIMIPEIARILGKEEKEVKEALESLAKGMSVTEALKEVEFVNKLEIQEQQKVLLKQLLEKKKEENEVL